MTNSANVVRRCQPTSRGWLPTFILLSEKTMSDLSREEALYYFKDEGYTVSWKNTLNPRIPNGRHVTNTDGPGYYQVRVNGKFHRVHRLLWIMRNGEIPNGMQVDHIDGNKKNNSVDNLRLCHRHENQRNSKLPSHNTSGVKGVSFVKRSSKWRARLKVLGVEVAIGVFDTIEEAEAAMVSARNSLHGEYARHA